MPNLPGASEFANNPNKRCACCVLIDTSGSMAGDRIDAVNAGLKTFKEELLKDPTARISVDVALMTFDSDVKLVCDFGTAQNFEPPALTAQNQTFLGTAISQALLKVEERKEFYKKSGMLHYRPWLFIITDGNPEGEQPSVLEDAEHRLHDAVKNKKVEVFAVGVGDDIDLTLLSRVAGKTALRLNEAKWDKLFVWLSKSVTAVSQSGTSGSAQLAVPDWVQISTG